MSDCEFCGLPVASLVLSASMMVCEDCESAVAHWMKTGDLRHYCAHCKGHMTCSPARAR